MVVFSVKKKKLIGYYMRWYEHSLKKVRVNYGILIFGLLLQSLVLFLTMHKAVRDDIIIWGLCAFMSIPYWVLILANRFINRTDTASNIITAAALIMVTGGSFIYFAASAGVEKDALGGLIFIFIPIKGTILAVFFSIIAIVFNKQR